MQSVTNWPEARQLTSRWQQPLGGIVNLVLALAVFIALWYIFMDPRGALRLYTPLYGFMWISWALIVAIWQVYIFNYWPYNTAFITRSHPLLKGLVMSAVTMVLVWLIIYVFFFNIFGKLAVPYFSLPALTGLGIKELIAREYSSLAVLMVAIVGTWISLIWPVAFDRYPWNGLTQPVRGFSLWTWTMLLSGLAYFLLIHPHFGVMFYPWQKFAAGFPWWQSFTQTIHGNFTVGFIMTATVTTLLTETVWERKPWGVVQGQPLRGIVTVAGILLMSLIIFNFFLLVQDLLWGTVVAGAQRTMAPNWRYLHAGEMSVFMLVVAVTLYFYFNNWPRRFDTEVNWLVRTAITFIGGTLLYNVYYKVGPVLLGTGAGKSDPQQFPIAPLMLLIAVMAVHHWYFDNWPGEKNSAGSPVDWAR